MQKTVKRSELGFMIFVLIYFVIVAGLYFTIPMIDSAIMANPFGVAYDPIQLFIDGALAFISFSFFTPEGNFNFYYWFIFITAALTVAVMILWLIFIIVKKKPGKLAYWFVFLLVTAASGVLASAYCLAIARTVTLQSGDLLEQTVMRDLLWKYQDFLAVDNNGKLGIPWVILVFLCHVLAWVVVALIGLIAIFGILTPLVSTVWLIQGAKTRKETPAERRAREKREAYEAAKARREAELLSYIDYQAGKPSRDKAYDDLCKANGLATKEDFEKAYYDGLAKELSVFKGEGDYYDNLVKELSIFDPNAKSASERYYSELEGELGVFHESINDKYYNDLVKELGVLNGQSINDEYYDNLCKELSVLGGKAPVLPEPVDNSYYDELTKELPILQEEVRLAKEESDRAYHARLAKELPVLNEPSVEEKEESDEEYHNRVRSELGMFKKAPEKSVEAVNSLKRQAAERGIYYDKMSKELGCLQYQKAPVEPEIKDSDDE